MKRILCAAWNLRSSVRISHYKARDLRHLRQLLEYSTKLMWHCPISLLIPRCPQFVGQSDALKIAMGGLCSPLLMQWRLYNSVFRCLPEWWAAYPDDPAFSINIQNFIALIINSSWWYPSLTSTDKAVQSYRILTGESSSWRQTILSYLAGCTDSLVWKDLKSQTYATSSFTSYYTLKLCFHTALTAITQRAF